MRVEDDPGSNAVPLREDVHDEEDGVGESIERCLPKENWERKIGDGNVDRKYENARDALPKVSGLYANQSSEDLQVSLREQNVGHCNPLSCRDIPKHPKDP